MNNTEKNYFGKPDISHTFLCHTHTSLVSENSNRFVTHNSKKLSKKAYSFLIFMHLFLWILYLPKSLQILFFLIAYTYLPGVVIRSTGLQFWSSLGVEGGTNATFFYGAEHPLYVLLLEHCCRKIENFLPVQSDFFREQYLVVTISHFKFIEVWKLLYLYFNIKQFFKIIHSEESFWVGNFSSS